MTNDIDTRFRIASISKVFTEVAVLQLVEQGDLSLDTKLSALIKDYSRGEEINTGIDSHEKLLSKRARRYMFDNAGQLVNAENVNMSIKIGGGSMYSTMDDQYRFIKHLVDGKLISPTLSEIPNFGEQDGQSVFTANGRVQGFCHQITHRMDDDLTIIILGNHYSIIALPISQDVYRIFSGETYTVPVNYLTRKKAIPASRLGSYTGVYDFGFGPIGTVKIIDDKLVYGSPGRKDFDTLIPLGDDTFLYIQNWVILRFRNNKNGRFQTLEWVMGDNAYPAQRVE